MSSPAKAQKKKRERQKRRSFRNGVGQVYLKRLGKWTWAYDTYIGGQRVQESGFSTREKAEAARAVLKRRALDEKYGLPSDDAAAPAVTLAQAVEARTSDPKVKRTASYEACVRVLSAFRDHFPAGTPVTLLKTADIIDFLTKKRSDAAPGTINRELNFIGAMMNSAGQYFPDLESWRPPRLPRPPETEERDRPLSLDEARRIVEWLRAPAARRFDERVRSSVADIFQLALMTGMRQGEWRTRVWREVDFEAGTIRLTKTKTGKARTIQMTAPVRAILERRHAARGESRYVFPGSYKGDRPMVEWSIRRQLINASEALGIPYGRNAEGGFTFHDTRHTAATHMLHEGHDLATVADILGHSKKTMTLKYSHATAESRKRTLESLEKFDFGAGVEEKQQADKEAGE